ncbi:hypothetical protein StoSoilB20_32420 [Arthrobacter sp. StoSoilB20]|nr:hypothetical protein StoSoilB20_32420 [Arthrobacter sp. StoSoilB20]
MHLNLGENMRGIATQFEVGILLDQIVRLLFSHGATELTPQSLVLAEVDVSEGLAQTPGT